ncbi:MAG TPA: hypothetical protein VMT10_14755, partial [Solirubrobacteraceae bacterium]|nr:hypothetical protein [Solirubrobacteraceae bacterium]
ASRREPFAGSREELTPLRGDPRAALPVALATAATLARPAFGQNLSAAAVSGYAMSPAAWRAIRRAAGPSPAG